MTETGPEWTVLTKERVLGVEAAAARVGLSQEKMDMPRRETKGGDGCLTGNVLEPTASSRRAGREGRAHVCRVGWIDAQRFCKIRWRDTVSCERVLLT